MGWLPGVGFLIRDDTNIITITNTNKLDFPFCGSYLFCLSSNNYNSNFSNNTTVTPPDYQYPRRPSPLSRAESSILNGAG